MTLEIELRYSPSVPVTDLPDNLYRVKHDIELPATALATGTLLGDTGREVILRKFKKVLSSIKVNNKTVFNILWRENVPEVYWMKPLHRVYMTKEWQYLMFDLFLWGAPKLGMGDYAKKKWSELYGCHRAFTNNTGFNCKKTPEHGPFANFITGEHLSEGLPALDKPRFCGGATIAGEVRDGKFWVETLTKVPTLDWLIKHPWLFFQATTVHADGTIGRFPQGDGAPVYVPLVSKVPVHYPLEYLEKVDKIADPYWIPSK